MTKKTRFFMLGSAAVMVVGLTVGLLAYFGGFPTTASSRPVGPEDLAYVPVEAAVVAYANVNDVMNSQFRQKMKEVMPEEDKGQAEFEQKTGINIERDVQHVLAFVIAKEGISDFERGGGMVVLARGQFDQARLKALATEHGGQVSEHMGRTIISAPERTTEDGESKNHHGVIAFLEDGLVAIGDEASVKLAIETQSGQHASITSASTEISTLITDAQGSGNAWAVGRFDVLTRNARLPEQVASQIPAITSFSATGHINGGVSGVFRAEARDEKAADNLRDVVRGFVAMAKLQTSNKPELQGLIDSLQIGGSGNTVAFTFAVPAELIDLLSSAAKQHHGVEP